jgi:hypothetical protein
MLHASCDHWLTYCSERNFRHLAREVIGDVSAANKLLRRAKIIPLVDQHLGSESELLHHSKTQLPRCLRQQSDIPMSTIKHRRAECYLKSMKRPTMLKPLRTLFFELLL